MSDFLTYEYVYPLGSNSNNATTLGTVNFRQDGSFEIINIQGNMFANGMIIVGEDSNTTNVLTNFDLSTRVEAGSPWDMTYALVNDAGSVIVEDDFFTGKRSQNYQQKDIIVALNIPVPDFILPTPTQPTTPDVTIDNIVYQGSEYVVLEEWFTVGANTANANIYTYVVTI
jgi:hypothetical protein